MISLTNGEVLKALEKTRQQATDIEKARKNRFDAFQSAHFDYFLEQLDFVIEQIASLNPEKPNKMTPWIEWFYKDAYIALSESMKGYHKTNDVQTKTLAKARALFDTGRTLHQIAMGYRTPLTDMYNERFPPKNI